MSDAASQSHGMILVLDDHYGVASEDFYSRTDFARDYAHLPFTFVYSSAWDEKNGRYTVEEAVRTVETHKPDGVLLDIVFDQRASAGQLGLAILRELMAKFPKLPVVMMTVLARDEVWSECARFGAVDYVPKPLDAPLLRQTLDRYVGVEPDDWLIGQNSLFLEAVNLVALAAQGGETGVMLTGESGTGKGTLARFLHRHGKRAQQPFETLFLPSIPGDMQAANLFGYRKGAFTGADRDEPGRFRAADGGVVFLDEIGDIDEATQLRLLRVTDTGEVTRLGDGKTSRVNVQLVTATNADLAQKIRCKEFRYDLWARLSGMPVNMPSLAQRRDDIPLLIRHLLRCQAIRRDRPVPELPRELEPMLSGFPWEGNVRALGRYAQAVFDLAVNTAPDASVFLAALRRQPTLAPEPAAVLPVSRDLPVMPATGAFDPEEAIQHLRLEELALLHRALEQTRDPVTGALNRAKAAALLKGKAKCSTNELDRWARSLWDELTSDNRELATQRFPELAPALKTTTSPE